MEMQFIDAFNKQSGVKDMRRPIKSVFNAAVIAGLTVSAANAGSFALYTESSVAALGNFAAGSAAEAADASTGWYNPAGLVLLNKQQMSLGAIGVYPVSKITGLSTFTTSGLPPYTQTFNHLSG